MGLQAPDLDDRTYEELLEDAIRQIPNVTDEWTDHNPSDPGITILEMLAWITESEIYRLNQITDDHIRRFLRLLGVEPLPAQPAVVQLAMDPQTDVIGTAIPSGEPLAAETDAGDIVPYETATDLILSPADIDAVVTIHHGTRTDQTGANDGHEQYYHPFGEDPVVNSAMYLGFQADPFDEVDRLDLTVDFSDDELATPAVHGPTVDGTPCPPAYPIPASGDESDSSLPEPLANAIANLAEPDPAQFEPSASVRWEHCVDPDRWRDSEQWDPLTVIRDDTNAFYGSGRVDLGGPTAWAGGSFDPFDRGEDHYWIRCLVTDPGHEIPPQLNAIHTNVIRVHQRREVHDERLESLDGNLETTAEPNQVFVFPHAPVQSASVTVGGENWAEVPDTAGSGPDDRHYVLDHEAGQISFGDGLNGEIPEPGLIVRATTYVHGGGRAGNLSTTATWRFVDTTYRDLTVGARKRLTDGQDAETTAAALSRARIDLKRPYRAITPEDIRHVAEHTPGLRFGRTAAFAEQPTGNREDCGTHGTIRVVVVPESTRPRPIPSPAFLEEVRCHLQHHRLLTDRISVESPEFVGVAVTTEIEIQEGYDEQRRIDAVESRLDTFLDPLDGFDGDGWPFGRPVYPSELYETIAAVEGIDCVHGVETSAQGEFEHDDGAVLIEERALVFPREHEIMVRHDDTPCRRWSS